MKAEKTERQVYYRKLKRIYDEGRLSTLLIIAPARTNSTLVEHLFGNSSDINCECHEPFFGAGRPGVDSDDGYKQIYDAIGGQEFELSTRSVSVVLKDIPHWISVNEEYKDLIHLTNRPILLLIRDPLLCLESRMRKMLTTMERKTGKEPLNRFAVNAGYESWKEVLEDKMMTEYDYAFFEEILKANVHGWPTEKSDFRELSEQAEYLASVEKPYLIVDTTDLLADPTSLVPELCRLTGLAYTPGMVDWETPSVDFHTHQNGEASQTWYDTLRNSTRIQPPTVIPPAVSMFPKFMQKTVLEEYLPIYRKLAEKKFITKDHRIRLNKMHFPIPVTALNMRILRRLGVITESVTEGIASVALAYICPIYALTNDPMLVRDSQFLEAKKLYFAELTA